jgi:hypothetical protein
MHHQVLVGELNRIAKLLEQAEPRGQIQLALIAPLRDGTAFHEFHDQEWSARFRIACIQQASDARVGESCQDLAFLPEPP